MRAVIVGGSGQIGGWLLRWLSDRGHEAFGTYATTPLPGLDRLDASELSASSAWVRGRRPDVVFYPAGFTWVDGCERDPALARSANLDQPLNLARTSAEIGARFVYYSTDYVFDGQHGPYVEDAPTNPLSVYGQAKRDAEIAIIETLGTAALILRTTWVFGPERQGKNFAYQLLRTLGDGKVLPCPSDQVSTPSYGPDLALASVLLVESGQHGIVHVAGPEEIDRPRFARALAEAFGLDTSLIVARTTAELGQGAPRPLRGGLLTPRLDTLLPGAMRSLSASLDDFKARLDLPR